MSKLYSDYVAATDTRRVRIERTKTGGRRVVGGPKLTSKSTKDCALSRYSKVGRERHRTPTRVGLSTGAGWDSAGLLEYTSPIRSNRKTVIENRRKKVYRQPSFAGRPW